MAFAIEHDILQECIGVAIVPMPKQPRISLLQLQDRLRLVMFTLYNCHLDSLVISLFRDHLHPSKWPFAIIYIDHLPQNRYLTS